MQRSSFICYTHFFLYICIEAVYIQRNRVQILVFIQKRCIFYDSKPKSFEFFTNIVYKSFGKRIRGSHFAHITHFAFAFSSSIYFFCLRFCYIHTLNTTRSRDLYCYLCHTSTSRMK